MEGTQGFNLNGALGSTNTRAHWDETHKEYFVTLLKETANMNIGYKNTKRCYQEMWAKITLQMKTQFPDIPFTSRQLKQLERDLKKSYKSLKEILKQPGFLWNYEKCTLEASESNWRNLFKRERQHKKWHRKILPYFGVLESLYERGHVLVPQAVSNNSESAFLQHNSSLINSGSVLTGPNVEMNGGEILPESDPNLNFTVEELNTINSDLNLPNSPPSPNLDLNIINSDVNLPNSLPIPNLDLRIDSQNRPDWHADQNGVPTNFDFFSISQCLYEYQRLGSNPADLQLVAEIFKELKNRVTYLAVQYKIEWLRDCIAERRKNAHGN